MKPLDGECVGQCVQELHPRGGTRTGSGILKAQLVIFAGNITPSGLGLLEKKRKKKNQKKKHTALCSKRNKNTSAKIRNYWLCQKEGGKEKSPNILPLVRAVDPQSPC